LIKKSPISSGIDSIGDLEMGTNSCLFYQTKSSLVEVLIPYFKAGLENSEFCMWILPKSLEIENAKGALGKAVSDFDTYLEKGQIEIISYTDWVLKEGVFDPELILIGWIEKFKQVLNDDYAGIRISWDPSSLEEEDWNHFTEYKKQIEEATNNYPILTLYTYFLDRYGLAEIINLALNHEFVFVKRNEKWKQIAISSHKKTEQAIFQIPKAREQLSDSASDIIAIIDNDYRIVYVNQVMAAKLGVTPEKCIGMTCYRVLHGVSEPPLFCPHKQLLKAGLEQTIELQENILDGVFSVKVSPFYNAEKELSGCVYLARDTSNHKHAKEVLRESEEKYRNIVETASEGIWIIDSEDRTTYVNKKMADMLGYSQEEMIGKSGWDFTDKEEAAIIKMKMKERQQNINVSDEFKLIRKDGSSLWAHANIKSFFNETGKFTGYLGIFTDISKRRQEEHKICRCNRVLEGINWIFSSVVQAKTEEELGNTCLSVALEVTDSEFGFINEIGTDGLLHDIAKSELGWEQCQMYDKTGHRRLQSNFVIHGLYGSVIKKEKSFFTNDPRAYPESTGVPEGHPLLKSFLGVPLIQDETVIGLIAVANREGGYNFEQQEDLEAIAPAVVQALQRRRSEETLFQSEVKYRQIVETSQEGIWLIDKNDRTIFVNQKLSEMLGYNIEEILGRSPQKFMAPEFLLYADNRLQEHTQGVSHVIDYRFIRKDGRDLWCILSSSPLFDTQGKYAGSLAMIMDITERRQVEEELRQSEERYRTLYESLRDAFVQVSMDGLIIEFNDLYCQMLGYSSVEMRALTYRELTPERWYAFEDYIVREQIIPRGYSDIYEKEYRRKDGTVIPVELRTILVRDEAGNPKSMWAIVRDITERRKAEEALKKARDTLEEKVKERTIELEEACRSLKESEAGLAEAQKMANIGNWDWNITKDETRWSEELYSIFGRNPEEGPPTQDEISEYIHPDDRAYVSKAFKEGLSGKENSIEFRIILGNGEERTIHVQTRTIFNKENIPTQVRGITQDITERKKTEEKIQVLVDAVESSNDAIGTLSLDGIVMSWNKGAEQIYGYSANEILGKNISIVEPDHIKGEIKRFSEGIKQGEKSQSYETLRVKKDGTIINISATLSPVFNSSQKLVAVLAIARDISERVKAEKELAEINKIRIKEIHHRIKNNLQVISSLLDLQAERFQNKEVLEAFKESQNRVISMALIHEELYKGGGTESLDFSVYLQKLAENLFQTYRLNSRNVCLDFDIEPNTFFDIDIAVPLGIIVNELISNSLKHAFNKNEKGEIRIKLSKKKGIIAHESTFNLIISDNGKGIPEDIKFENLKSLGLMLVKILVEQLNGKIAFKRTHGAEFRISFNVIESS
jgi:PAS domain S-box-containing protein